MYIPADEIKQPMLHADTLGFTFVWHGHFLRGVYPESVSLAKSYFDTGFLKEVIDKGLFPNTWISEYESDLFGLILEHEMIEPVTYASDWNSAMLKDAALMVLNIAQIAFEYGYNMVDCHKLNVMFSGNKPLYVDLGSFVPNKSGSTGWNPYASFLHSYYFILRVWASGAETMAKRMMAPGLELSDKEYFVFKSRFFRLFPQLIGKVCLLRDGMCRLAVWDNVRVSQSGKLTVIAKRVVNMLSLSGSQRLKHLTKKVERIAIKQASIKPAPKWKTDELNSIVQKYSKSPRSLVLINPKSYGYFEELLLDNPITCTSIQENDSLSNIEYKQIKNKHYCSTSFRLLNNTIVVKKEFPEQRLKSDIVCIPDMNLSLYKGQFGIHNALVFIDYCTMFAKKLVIVYLNSCSETNDVINVLAKKDNIEVHHSANTGEFLILRLNEEN